MRLAGLGDSNAGPRILRSGKPDARAKAQSLASAFGLREVYGQLREIRVRPVSFPGFLGWREIRYGPGDGAKGKWRGLPGQRRLPDSAVLSAGGRGGEGERGGDPYVYFRGAGPANLRNAGTYLRNTERGQASGIRSGRQRACLFGQNAECARPLRALCRRLFGAVRQTP